MKKRITYIDVAKGILICCLLYGHMLIYACAEGINDSVMPIMWESVSLYNAFFMQTFFLITGLCSSFNKEFKSFLWGNVKALIIPSIIMVIISFFIQQFFMNHTPWSIDQCCVMADIRRPMVYYLDVLG